MIAIDFSSTEKASELKNRAYGEKQHHADHRAIFQKMIQIGQ